MNDPDLDTLFALFPGPADTPDVEPVPGEAVPEPYHGLLVHTHHMTVTQEAFHGDRVNVRVLTRARGPDWYARKILLTLAGSGRVVQFGLVRIRLQFVADPVRERILEEKSPLGRILIENNVLRRIDPRSFFRVNPGPAVKAWFGIEAETFGRLGVIFCDEQPAIEVVEITSPQTN